LAVAADPLLFPDVARSDPQTKRAHESEYAFFQRINDPACGRIRDLFNDWFDRFAKSQDAEAVADLRQRFRAKQRGQFFAAFWELYLHELFSRLGFEAQVHPSTAKRGTRPDFLMTRGETRFYLEAVMPTPGFSPTDNQPASVETVTEYVNEAFQPQFRFRLRHIIPGSSMPRKKAVIRAVVGWLDSLDWADCWKGDPQSSIYPETELHIGDGWQIKLVAIPLDPSLQSAEPRPMIFSHPSGGGYPDGLGQAVLPLLIEKTSKYGNLDAPLMIAMWVADLMANPETAPLALFGSWFSVKDGSHRTGLELRDDRVGLWTPGAKTRGRACGVLAANSFGFGYPAVARALPRYWSNPWADKPLTLDLPFPTSTVSHDETMVVNSPETISPAELFELPEDWPGEPFQNLYSSDNE
jgi:hypothetical protein